MPHPSRRWLPWLICAAGLGLKLAQILVDPDLFLDTEELGRGLAARELLDGPALRLLDYQMDPYAGGSLGMGLAALPFFAAFGDSFLSLKLATLPFLLALALATWALLRRLDPRAAPLGLALVFLAPWPATRLALVAWGDSVQVPIFSALALLCALPLVTGSSPRAARAGLLGLCCGLGLSWHYHFAIPLLLLAALLPLGDRAWLRRPACLLALLAGGALGLLPWLAYNLGHAWEGLSVSSYGSVAALGEGLSGRYAGRLLALCTAIPAASLGPGPASWRWTLPISAVAWLAFLAAAAWLAWRERGAPGGWRGAGWARRWLLLYAPAFALLAAATPYSFANEPAWYFADRYLASLHWAVLVLVPLAAAALWAAGGWRRDAGLALAGLFLAIGTGAQASALSGLAPRGPLHARDEAGRWKPAFDWALLADERIGFAFWRGDLAEPLAQIRAAEDPRRLALCEALGLSMARGLGPELPALEGAAAQLAGAGEARAFWRGAGRGLGRWHSEGLDALLPATAHHPAAGPLLEGLEQSLGAWYGGDAARALAAVERALDGPRRDAFLRRLGVELSVAGKRNPARVLASVATLGSPAQQPLLLEGVCRDLATQPPEPEALRRALAEAGLAPGAAEGFGACLLARSR